jgi:hypothetical protein
MKAKGEKVKGKRLKAEVAADLRVAVPELRDAPIAKQKAPPLGTAAATTEEATAARSATATLPKRTASEAGLERWRKVRAGELADPTQICKPRRRPGNPLLHLPDEPRARLFAWLRECPYVDHVQQMLRDQGVGEVTRAELNEFFRLEAEQHWETRISRAAQEADALVKLVEKSPVRFSAGILAALGQEAFRQIANGQVDPSAMGKLATLFLKARSDERADQMQELKREKLRHELEEQVEHALEKLAEEVDRHPAARKALDALRKELAENAEETE